jgi:hypothetical protein
MNFLKTIDAFLFGPTVAYAVTSRYPLEEAIERLRQAVTPWLSPSRMLVNGPIGSINADRVIVAWHRVFVHDSTAPRFDGAFAVDARGVRLVGTIGASRAMRVLFYAMLAVWLGLAGAFWSSSPAGAPAWFPLLFAALVIFAIVVTAAVNRAFSADRQRIADVLDAALS